MKDIPRDMNEILENDIKRDLDTLVESLNDIQEDKISSQKEVIAKKMFLTSEFADANNAILKEIEVTEQLFLHKP